METSKNFINVIKIIISMKYTTISVSPETKKILKELGSKGETYDEIVRRLIHDATWKKLDERWNKILEKDEFIPFEEL